MQKIKMILMMLLTTCLTSCETFPKAPLVDNCAIRILELNEDRTIVTKATVTCFVYKFDVFGGETIGEATHVFTEDVYLSFAKDGSWLPLTNWRDKAILYVEDEDLRCKK